MSYYLDCQCDACAQRQALADRIRELVAADRAFDEAQASFVTPRPGVDVDTAADICEQAAERRRRALEVFP